MRRLLSLCLIVCLVFCLLPAMSAASASGSGVCFIATNDNLLELTYQPYWQNSTIYVPYTVFVNFKVYNSFHQSSNTASLYSSTKQLYFDLNTGETYDGNGTYYNITPVSRGGQIYVPLDFICGQYGLTWSYIDGGEYGDVCRIKDGSVFLTDDQFLTAAKPLMVSRYNAYVGNSGGNWAAAARPPTPAASSTSASSACPLLRCSILWWSTASGPPSSSPPTRFARARTPSAASWARATASARSAPRTRVPSTPRYPPSCWTPRASRPCS